MIIQLLFASYQVGMSAIVLPEWALYRFSSLTNGVP